MDLINFINNFYFGHHPKEEVYISFTNDYLLDRIKKWIDEKPLI